jgi:hypothetical protein
MTRFEGDGDFPQPPMDLFAKQTDARFLATCIPDVKSVTEQEANRAVLAGDKVAPEIRWHRPEIRWQTGDKVPEIRWQPEIRCQCRMALPVVLTAFGETT